MTAENKISITVSQDLPTGEFTITSEGNRLSFPIVTRMVLSALKVLKDNIIQSILTYPEQELKACSFPNATIPTALASLTLEQLREEIALKAEGEMYDLLNLAISNFLDTEFDRVNSKLSLTEEAAVASGLNSSATTEELIEAENAFINEHPDLAAKTQDLQPKKIAKIHLDKQGYPSAHPDNQAGGFNRATRRSGKIKLK